MLTALNPRRRGTRYAVPQTIPPLPWRVRFRLRCQHARNAAGIWLVEHDMTWAARKLWRIP